MWYLCFLLYTSTCIVEFVNGVDSQRYKQENILKGRRPTKYIQLNESSRGVSECAGLCQRTAECWSFFYSKIKGRCLLSQNLEYRIQDTTPEFGYQHFVPGLTGFSDVILKGRITEPAVNDVSGVAASRRHNVIYVVNEGGGDDNVYALDVETGNAVATLTVSSNGDWEDIAVGTCGSPGTYCIYICDFGESSDRELYKMEEPTILQSTVMHAQKLNIHWSGALNVETLMIDPEGNAYIITTGRGAQVARVPTSAWGSSSYTVPQGTPVSFKPVGGDISPYGGELLIKTISKVYVYSLKPYQNYIDLLTSSNYYVSPHTPVRKGTSIGWSASGHGFYILTEIDLEYIHFYQRKILP